MSWNYRVVRYADGSLALHEVYYDEAGEPRWRTTSPCCFGVGVDEGLDGLIESLQRGLADARERPILDDAVFGGPS